MAKYDVIVVGCGGGGSAALHYAARRGLKALGLEQFHEAHDRGSSHGETRAIRMAYTEHEEYIPILHRAYSLWRELESQVKRKFFHETGLLMMGEPTRESISGAIKNAAQHGIKIEQLDSAEVLKRFPGFYISKDMIGVFEHGAGILRVEECVQSHLSLAMQCDAKLNPHERFLSWESIDNNTILVKTDQNSYHTKRLIITAGAWAGQVLHELRLPLTILRKGLYWFHTQDSTYAISKGTPPFSYDLPEGFFYGFPQISETIKVARHSGGIEITDPEEAKALIDNEEQQAVEAFVQKYLTKAQLNIDKSTNCFYTNAKDHQFIVDTHPENRNIAFAAGLAGYGFKMSNVIGETLVQMVTQEPLGVPIEFLGLKRFN